MRVKLIKITSWRSFTLIQKACLREQLIVEIHVDTPIKSGWTVARQELLVRSSWAWGKTEKKKSYLTRVGTEVDTVSFKLNKASQPDCVNLKS